MLGVKLQNVNILNCYDNKYLISGEYKYIYKLYKCYESFIQRHNIKRNIYIKCCLGYAGWSRTQLYGEFAKLNWGITNIPMETIFRDNNYDLINKDKILMVKKNMYSENN